MENYSVYEDIASRTNGDIYIGVVGPVRTGKSTFIKRFMERMVIPSSDASARSVMVDELPQSAAGKTVMTTEPKFVPAKAAKIAVAKGAEAKIRLVDCVGFAVEGASGFEEDGKPRLVKTPWNDEPMPFEEAAAVGTEKVIREHSTIGLLVTTDGSVTDIPRDNYVLAEERAANALKEIGKPFVVVLNCKEPKKQEKLRAKLQEKYLAPVVALNAETMSEEEILFVLQSALLEFPVARIDVKLPKWLRALPETNETVASLLSALKTASNGIVKMKDCFTLETVFSGGDFLLTDGVTLDLGQGVAEISLKAKDNLFYEVLSAECGESLDDDLQLMRYVKKLSASYKKYEKIKDAFEGAERTGYGVVEPLGEDLRLDKPYIVKKGAGYGAKFKASAASYHVIKIGINGEIQPIIGTKDQSEAFVGEIISDYETDPTKVWETNIFGKSLRELIGEEFAKKTQGLPPELGKKLTKIISRIVNDGKKGGILCILV